MLISLLIPKNMQNFSQFYRLISKIVFFSTQKLQVRFPTGGAVTGSLPGRPERLKNVPDHPVEAPVKITRWRSLVMTFWNFNKIASLLFQHSNDFCKCNFYILKLSMWNLHRYGWDIEDGARKHFGPVVSPSRFANLRNNGAGHLTFSFSKNFSSSFCQTLIVFPKHFRTSNHKRCYNSKKLCSMTILEENLTKKCQNRIVELKLIFCVKIIFFSKNSS